MTTKTTKIAGLAVELELYQEDGEARSSCFISKGRFSGSLECLTGMGVLDDGGSELAVRQEIIDKIEAWADANGYND